MRSEIQREALEAWVKSSYKGVVVLPTGFGKTRLGVMASALDPTLETLVITSRINLIKQWEEEFTEMGVKVPEIVCINTACKYTRRVDLLIVDECHRSFGPKFKGIYSNIQYDRLLLLTASPPLSLTTKSVEMPCEIVYTKSMKDAVKIKAVSEYEMYNVEVPFDKKSGAKYKVFNQMFLEGARYLNGVASSLGSTAFDLAKEHSGAGGNTKLSEAAKKFWTGMSMRKLAVYGNTEKQKLAHEIIAILRDRKWIVFFKSIKDAKAFYEGFSEREDVFIYHSDMKDRAGALQKFGDSPAGVLICVDALDEGLNIPSVDAAIAVAGVSTEISGIQRLGRIVRAKEGKKALFINISTRDTVEVRWTKERTKTFGPMQIERRELIGKVISLRNSFAT